MSRLYSGRRLAVYTLLALLLTWPLASQFASHVPGDGIDDPSLAWNLWWINARLVNGVKLDIFHVDWMFYPIGINLGFYTLTPLNGLLSLPLQTSLSLIIANNLLLLLSFVLGGFGAFLLARQELRFTKCDVRITTAAAFFAGMIYAFASSKLFYVSLGQFNIASSQWIPFCALYALRLARSTTYRSGLYNASLAALFLSFQAWAELTYASFLIMFVVLVFGWSLFPRSTQRDSHKPIRDSRCTSLPDKTCAVRENFLVKSTHSQFTIHNSLFTVYNFLRLRRLTVYGLRFTTFALLAFLFLIGITPFLWAMIPDLLMEGDFFASGGGFADTYSADLVGYLLPTQLHPILGEWVQQLPFDHDKGQQIFVGYTASILAVLGAVALLRQKRTRSWGSFWLVTILFFWWLTLGPDVRWFGTELGIPGPFALISRLPFFSGNRYPSRYSVMLMLSVAVLAAAGTAYLLSRLSISRLSISRLSISRLSTLLSPLLMLLFLFEHLSVPLPMSDFRVPSIYAQLAAAPGDFTLLELPTGWRNGARVMGKSDLLIMMQQWYQTTHGKRRLGGNTSRNPLYKFQYFINAPLLGDLIALMNDAPQAGLAQIELARYVETELDAIIARNRPIADEVLTFLDVEYVTVHVEKASPALLRFVDEALPLTLVDTWQGPDWSGAPSTIRLYQVNQKAQPERWSVDLAAGTSTLYLAEGWAPLGWQGMRYATRPCATLLLDLPEEAGTLSVDLAADANRVTTVTTALNGQVLRPIHNANASTVLTLPLAAGVAAAAVDRLTLCISNGTPINALAAPPSGGGWPIGETGATLPVSLLVQSAGNDVGNFAQIRRNGVPLLQAATGYNLVALNAVGNPLATVHYNTFADETAANDLAGWLQQWPTGTVIAGAVMDEASNALTQQAVDALATIGVATDLRERFRWSHAFVGVVGAEAGTALESASLLQPATVAVGVPVDEPAVYIGVKQIAYRP